MGGLGPQLQPQLLGILLELPGLHALTLEQRELAPRIVGNLDQVERAGDDRQIGAGQRQLQLIDDPAGFGVAIETWSHAIFEGKKSSTLPYFHWIFPYCKLRLSGDRVIENGMLATTFDGYGLGNTEFSSGPDERWEFPLATERPYSYARSTWAPTGRKGFYTWHGDITASITNSARTGSTATITTSTAHNFAVGDSVVVSGTNGNAPLEGTWTIASVPSTTTFTYTTSSSGTITSAADTGTALVSANSRAVTDFTGQGSTTAYNVPGNEGYNADEATDFIIASTEDPTS